MNSRRTVIIAAALALAALAFFGNVYYLKSAQDRANKNAELVEVFVVKKQVPKGLPGEQAISQVFVRSGEIPLEFRPGSAIKDINDIKGKVAINDLSPGQVVVDGQFVDPNVANVTFAQRVPAGQVAVSLSVDQVHGVAGLLLPGDKVDAMVVTNRENQSQVRTLYQNVSILAIGAKPAPQAGDTSAETKAAASSTPTDAGLITFAVPLEAAQKVAFVSSGLENTSFYLALVPPDSSPVEPIPGATNGSNLFNTNGPTPYPNN